jgi:hypothetical protein
MFISFGVGMIGGYLLKSLLIKATNQETEKTLFGIRWVEDF